jgi:hypothetical protein
LNCPLGLVVVVDFTLGVIGVHQADFDLFTHDIILTAMVQSAGDPFGQSKLLISESYLQDFKEIVDLKFIEFGTAVFKHLKQKLFLDLS